MKFFLVFFLVFVDLLYAATCVKKSANTAQFNCSNSSKPSYVDTQCIITCSYTSGRSYYTYLEGLTQQSCNNALNYCDNFCDLYPEFEGCTDRCAVYREQCERLGGHFEGYNLSNGCAANCNTCGARAQQIILDIKIQSCCSQGLAPQVDRLCFTPDIVENNPGMQVSTNADDLVCVDPNIDDENLALYVEYCSDEPPGSSSSQVTSSSSGGGGDGSSSSGESSSSGDEVNSSVSGENGDDYNYYPILDTIRDSVVNIRKNVEKIYLCMTTPGACPGLSPDIKIDVPSDSNFLKDINSTIGTTNIVLDTSLKNGNERLRNSIASANDTLIDSLRKFLGGSSAGFSGDTLGDSLGRIHRTLEDLKAMFEAGEIDSAVFGSEYGGYIAHGELLKDSILGDLGWADIDTITIDSIFSRSSWDTSGIDSVSDFVNDTLADILDSLHLQLKNENDSIIGSLPDSLTVWADSLIKVSPFVSFDSLIYSTIGAKIPNSDQCPEDCQSWSLDLPRFGLINYTVDFGLCLGRVPLGGLNVLGFLRLIIRLVIVWTCISVVMWNFSQRKM